MERETFEEKRKRRCIGFYINAALCAAGGVLLITSVVITGIMRRREVQADDVERIDVPEIKDDAPLPVFPEKNPPSDDTPSDEKTSPAEDEWELLPEQPELPEDSDNSTPPETKDPETPSVANPPDTTTEQPPEQSEPETPDEIIELPPQSEEPPSERPVTPATPAEPEIPTESEQPSEPQPTEPEQPVAPATPAEPEIPTESEQPSEPQPTEPEQPVAPATPAEPEIPTEPEQPSEPQPTEPEQPVTPATPTEPEKDSFTEGLVFVLNSSGDGYVVANYIGTETEINIPALYEGLPVVGIGDEAFFKGEMSQVALLRKVTLGKNVKTIGINAFSGQSLLTEVIFDDALEEIKQNAFMKTGLSSFTAPASLRFIDMYAFFGTNIKEVTLPERLRGNIGKAAFGIKTNDNVTFAEQ